MVQLIGLMKGNNMKTRFSIEVKKYAADVWNSNDVYAGDVMFFGDDFLNKCEKVDK